MDSKLRKMGILASMAVILLVALAVMYVNREQLSPTSGQNTAVSGAQNAGDGEAVDPVPEGTGKRTVRKEALPTGRSSVSRCFFQKRPRFFSSSTVSKYAIISGTLPFFIIFMFREGLLCPAQQNGRP